MKTAPRTRTILATGAALLGVALGASACDASPYAASVNGDTISQAYLNNQLKLWAANKTWVASFDSANSQQNGGSGATVTGSGGKDTYSATFVSDILDTIIQVKILHQHLAGANQLPTQDELVASRAVNEYLRSDYWDQFAPSLRNLLVEQLADQGALTPVPSNVAALQGAYLAIQPYLFYQICVKEASAFSSADVQKLATAGNFNGAQVCLSQTDFENQSPAFQSAVVNLTPNSVSQPIQTSFGFEVVQVVSRSGPTLSIGVQHVLAAATAQSEPPQILDLMNRAKVKLNPAYGTWAQGQVNPPQLSSS